MSRLLTLVVLAVLAASGAQAQTVETGEGAVGTLPAGALNGVGALDADGGTLRAGPRLVEVAPDGAVSFPGADPVFDPQTTVDPRAYAIDARGETVVVGLGFSDVTADADQPPATAAGFAVSTDGGRSYSYRFEPLDESFDSTVVYGVSTLRAFPATVPQGSAPLDVALTAGADTVYSANLLAGLRRSTDGGATWEPVVTPPDSLLVLDPRETYDFVYTPDLRQPLGFVGGDRNRPVFPSASTNFVAYSVLVDEAGTVWAGMGGGLNRSVKLPGSSDPAWLRYVDLPIGSTIPSNQVYALEARPREGRDHIWAACWVPEDSGGEQEFGVSVWRGDDADGVRRVRDGAPGRPGLRPRLRRPPRLRRQRRRALRLRRRRRQLAGRPHVPGRRRPAAARGRADHERRGDHAGHGLGGHAGRAPQEHRRRPHLGAVPRQRGASRRAATATARSRSTPTPTPTTRARTAACASGWTWRRRPT